jgi:L-threonylcarbamoyladenylate synthase
MARILSIATEHDRALAEAGGLLKSGHVIAIPTETVYGLAADATNPAAIARIYETKGRPTFNPLICHMADLAMAETYADFDPLSRQLAEQFWPGPLTLILPLKHDSAIHPLATAGLPTVGIRIPEGFAGSLIAAYGQPLAAPSANTSGRISPTTAAHVEADLGDKIALILDGGAASVGVESTIIRVEDGQLWLLRPGGLAAEAIEAATGLRVHRIEGQHTAIVAPGMLATHYAPSAHMRLNATRVLPGEALIGFGPLPVAGSDQAVAQFQLSESGDLVQAAANLFDMMKQADATGAAMIAVAPIPDHGLGEAINDRLIRAAAPRDM